MQRSFQVIRASKDVGVAKRVGYQRLERWNETGYDGLIPRYAGKSSRDSQKIRRENLIHGLKPRIPGILAIS
jgi:transposase